MVCLTISDATLVPASLSESIDLICMASRYRLLQCNPSEFEPAISSVTTRPLCPHFSLHNKHQHKRTGSVHMKPVKKKMKEKDGREKESEESKKEGKERKENTVEGCHQIRGQ